MFIDEVNIVNFRNFEKFRLKFDKKNYIIGSNGSGKTTIIESIYTSFYRKSFRTPKPSELIRFNCKSFTVKTHILKDNLNNNFYYHYSNSNKVHLLNGKRIKNLYEIATNFPIIIHSPYHEGLTDKLNKNKISLIDKTIIILDKEYKIKLQKFNKLLKHKKALLEKNNRKLFNTINELIIELYDNIYTKRLDVINTINKMLKELTPIKNIEFKLIKPDIAKLLNMENSKKKLFLTLHSQKLYISKTNTNIENFLSYGQKKELSIYSIYCLLKVIEENLKDDIILLLDDFETGLDEKKVKTFYEVFSKNQIIITGVESRYLNNSDINIISIREQNE